MNLVFAILLLLFAVFLILAVLFQSSKSQGLSGSITGSTAETFFGKDKGTRIDRMLGKLTAICGIVFVVVVLLVYIVQPDYSFTQNLVGSAWQNASQYFPK